MVTPYLDAKQGWNAPVYLHDDLRPILGQTQGVVVFHEQVIEMIAQFTGISYAEADEKRRALGDEEGMADTKLWFFPRALGRGYSTRVHGMEEIVKPSAIILDEKFLYDLLKTKRIIFSGSGAVKLKTILKNEHAVFSDIQILPEALAELSYKNFMNSNFASISLAEPSYIKDFYTHKSLCFSIKISIC